MYSNNDPAQQPTTSKRSSLPTQPRLMNGQFARIQPQKREMENKVAAPSTSVPYLSHDHQYQKPMPPNYNGYSPQRQMHPHFQQNYSYQHQQSYPNNQMMNQQQAQAGYASPSSNAYHSPQHPGMQSPHAMGTNVPPGFQSPTYSTQVGYHSPGHPMMSPQPNYGGRQDYHYPSQTDRQHIYVNQQQQQQQQPAVFQSPPHQPQYQSPQYYQRPSPVAPQPNQSFNQQQGYHNMHNQYSNSSMYQQPNHANNQSYTTMQNQYRQHPKQMVESQPAGYGASNNPSFQIYQSPQPSQNSYRSPAAASANIPAEPTEMMPVRQDTHETSAVEQNGSMKSNSSKNTSAHKSPTSALRNVRHDQPSNVKSGQTLPDICFSSQYLNFISNRNEPKDNANTPKFSNSPSISQKMHKNLYVSSPEQAQIPPSSGMSDSDSKDGMTAQTGTPIQSAKISHTNDKQKDLSKRQLDFEQRVEFQSEDSRDSVSKDGRISSVYSRQSDLHSDGYGMDVDSENSMECAAFKSTHSISLIETSDIPRPADIDFPKLIDPFNKKLIDSLLDYVKFPNKTHAEGYVEVRSIPKLQLATVISVGNNKLSIDKQLGKGNYGAVFLCLDLHSNKSVAVKYQKPSRPWEFYICQEIKARIKDPFMVIICSIVYSTSIHLDMLLKYNYTFSYRDTWISQQLS